MDLRVIENRCVLYMYSTRLSVRVDFVAKGCVCVCVCVCVCLSETKENPFRVWVCKFPIYSYCNVTVIFPLL
jgi:hypothetical protein